VSTYEQACAALDAWVKQDPGNREVRSQSMSQLGGYYTVSAWFAWTGDPFRPLIARSAEELADELVSEWRAKP